MNKYNVFFKIYFWQGLSIMLNLISMYVVIPSISDNKEIYGIYSICISINVFFSYADLGFLNAGYKYACEFFAISDIQKEIEVTGFVSFILLITLLFFSFFLIVLMLNPSLIIGNTDSIKNLNTASILFSIQVLTIPIVFFQKIMKIIFGARMKDYNIQKINVLINICKIISVFFFFTKTKSDIVGYYFFSQVLNFLGVIIAIFIIINYLNYPFVKLLKAIKFNRYQFDKTKDLSLSNFLLTISWVFYYELDLFVIGKLHSLSEVSTYSIGLTLLTFFRTFFGMFYSPFVAQFNYFKGRNDFVGLGRFLKKVIDFGVPLFIFSIFSIFVLMDKVILTWVGYQYSNSIAISRILILSSLFGFITYPISIFLNVIENTKILYMMAFIIPFIYWITIFVLEYFNLGLLSFAISKLFVFSILGIAYLMIYFNFFRIDKTIFFKTLVVKNIAYLSSIFMLSFIISFFLDTEKSKISLSLTFGGIFILVLSHGLLYLRKDIFQLIKKT